MHGTHAPRERPAAPGRSARRGWTASQRPRTTSIPESTSSSFGRASLPVRSVRSVLSSVTSWETLATDSFGSPVALGGSRTFPGAVAHFRLLVKGTQTTVAIRLRLSASPWTTTTGRRKPGPEPLGSGRSAHQTSPWAMVTSRCGSGRGGKPCTQSDPRVRRSRRALGPSLRSHDRKRDEPRTQRELGCTSRFATASSVEPAARPLRIRRPGRRRQLSYR